jgi:hypothetical protein
VAVDLAAAEPAEWVAADAGNFNSLNCSIKAGLPRPLLLLLDKTLSGFKNDEDP